MATEQLKGSAEAVNDAASRAAQSASSSSSSALDRFSQWYSENKVLAWTIVGVALFGTGAAIAYSSSSSRSHRNDGKERKSKKERRKEKEAARDAAKPTEGSGA